MQSEKGIDPRGDAALLAAINDGSPVPTTPEQSQELPPFNKTDRVRCHTTGREGLVCATFDNGKMIVMWSGAGGAADECRNSYRDFDLIEKYTPAAGKWKVRYANMSHRLVSNGVRHYYVGRDHADDIASRLNAADAMERVLSRIASAEAPFSYPQAQSFVDDASSALRK